MLGIPSLVPTRVEVPGGGELLVELAFAGVDGEEPGEGRHRKPAPPIIGTRPAVHLVSEARSSSFINNFYKVEDRNEAWLDPETPPATWDDVVAIGEALMKDGKATGCEVVVLGLNMAKFKKDMEDEATNKQLEADKAEAAKYGARGTPSFFINGWLQ